MVELIILLILLVIGGVYLHIEKKHQDFYNQTQYSKQIDIEYNDWYSKENIGTLLNHKQNTKFYQQAKLYKLKELLEQHGIEESDIKNYVEFLKNGKGKPITLKRIFDGIIYVFGGSSFLYQFFPEWEKKGVIKNLYDTIQPHWGKYANTITIIGTLGIIITVGIGVIWMMFKIGTFQDRHKKLDKIRLLTELLEIWDYSIDGSVTENSDAVKGSKKIYPNIKLIEDEKSKMEVGEEVNETFNELFGGLESFCKKIFQFWLKGKIPYRLFITLHIFVSIILLSKVTWQAILVCCVLITVILIVFLLFYIAQLKKNTVKLANVEQAERDNQLKRNSKNRIIIFASYLVLTILFLVIAFCLKLNLNLYILFSVAILMLLGYFTFFKNYD